MFKTNISQIRLAVMKEVVPNFFMEVSTKPIASDIKVGARAFIYNTEGDSTPASCITVMDEHTEFKDDNGFTHTVPNIEPSLNSFEFARLLSIIGTPEEQRSGYDEFVVNRAISASVLEYSKGQAHELTQHGKALTREHFTSYNLNNRQNIYN